MPAKPRDDEADAALIVGVAASLRSWAARTGAQPPLKILREAVWFFWQQPRLERPLVRPKYPRAVPWSREAADVVLSGGPRSGRLVIEHVEPLNRTLRWLIESERSVEEVMTELPTRLECVVVTAEQSRGLPDAGSPHDRYAAAGLDLSAFKPLDDWSASDQGSTASGASLGLRDGDVRWDAMGRQWQVVRVDEAGAHIRHPEAGERYMEWGALMTLGVSEHPPSGADPARISPAET
ncbi:MAG TPA: hypothetical protein VF533_08430 [Solirubrobacteraceae bacterium]|jgi:hypothetical protein